MWSRTGVSRIQGWSGASMMIDTWGEAGFAFGVVGEDGTGVAGVFVVVVVAATVTGKIDEDGLVQVDPTWGW